MRLSNKLKIIMIILLTYIAIMLTPIALSAQGPPNGWPDGGNGGGPPPPPPNYCNANPSDPACQDTTVPVGSEEATFALLLCAIGLGYYMLNKNKLNDNRTV